MQDSGFETWTPGHKSMLAAQGILAAEFGFDSMDVAKPPIFVWIFMQKRASLNKFARAGFHPDPVDGFLAVFWENTDPFQYVLSAGILPDFHILAGKGVMIYESLAAVAALLACKVLHTCR